MNCSGIVIVIELEDFTSTRSLKADLCRGLLHASEIHQEQTSEPLHLHGSDAQGFCIYKHTNPKAFIQKKLSNNSRGNCA